MRVMVRACVIALVVAQTACDAPAVPTASPGETPAHGGTIVLAARGDVPTLQPILSTDDVIGSALNLIYWTMLEREPSGALRAGLADRFSVSGDGRTVTFHLADGALWSDGTPITAEDYRYTVEAVARSRTTLWHSKFEDVVGWSDYAKGRADQLSGIRSLDGGRTVEVALTRSSCLALEHLNIPPIPRHRFVTQWDDRTTDTSTSIDKSPLNMVPPVASGPFVFREYVPGDRLVLARNDRFFKGAPIVDGMVFNFVANTSAERNAFVVGNSAWLTPVPADVDYVRQQMGTSVREYRFSGRFEYQFIAWNQNAAAAPWLADKRVRQALWYGLDVKTIADRIQLGFAHPVYAHTPPASWAYDGSGLNHYDYDPKRARTLLESAGAVMGGDGLYRWTDGRVMEVRIETNAGNDVREQIVQIAQQQYRDVGIRVVPVIEAFATLSKRVTPADGSVQGVLLGWSLDPDPDGAYNIWHSSARKDGFNFVGMNDARVDAALEAVRFGPDCGADARRKAISTVDHILNEEAPYVFLFQTDTVLFVNTSLVRPTPQRFAGWTGVETWWLRH